MLAPISHHHGRLQVPEGEHVIPRIVVSRKIDTHIGEQAPLGRIALHRGAPTTPPSPRPTCKLYCAVDDYLDQINSSPELRRLAPR